MLRPRKTPPLGPAFDVTSLTAEDRWEIVTNSRQFPDRRRRLRRRRGLRAERSRRHAGRSKACGRTRRPSSCGARRRTRDGTTTSSSSTAAYMFPTGHRAVLVTIVERIFAFDPNNSELVVAYLQEITYIRIVEQTKSYPAPGQAFSGRGWPFSSVRIAARTSPLLDSTRLQAVSRSSSPSTRPCRSPCGDSRRRTSHDVLWPLVLTDSAGNSTVAQHAPRLHRGRAPISIQSTDYAGSQYDSTMTQYIAEAYNKLSLTNPTFTRLMKFEGRKVRYALEASGHPGATTLPTIAIFLGAATRGERPERFDDRAGDPVPGGAQGDRPAGVLPDDRQRTRPAVGRRSAHPG